MAFSIFCHGNDSFHYGCSRVPVMGDLYEIESAMGILTTGGTEGVAEALTGVVQDAVMDEVTEGLPDYELQAQLEREDGMLGLHRFRQGVGLAMMDMPSLRVALTAQANGWLWNDAAFAQATLHSGDQDASEHLLRAITPALTTAGLNCGGVLGMIGTALSEFSTWGGAPFGVDAPARFLLNIDLTRL